MEYIYPLDPSWTTEEMVVVVRFFETIEKAYEERVRAHEVVEAYHALKTIVPSKAEEKTIFRKYAKASTYESYPVVRRALNEASDAWIQMSE